MPNDLLNCPFCGSTAEIQTVIEPDKEQSMVFDVIRCTQCKCTTPEREHKDKDVDPADHLKEVWNRRIPISNKEVSDHLNKLNMLINELNLENSKLKFVLAQTNAPCVYCGRTKDEMTTCSEPDGCGRAEDLNQFNKRETYG